MKIKEGNGVWESASKKVRKNENEKKNGIQEECGGEGKKNLGNNMEVINENE